MLTQKLIYLYPQYYIFGYNNLSIGLKAKYPFSGRAVISSALSLLGRRLRGQLWKTLLPWWKSVSHYLKHILT